MSCSNKTESFLLAWFTNFAAVSYLVSMKPWTLNHNPAASPLPSVVKLYITSFLHLSASLWTFTVWIFFCDFKTLFRPNLVKVQNDHREVGRCEYNMHFSLAFIIPGAGVTTLRVEVILLLHVCCRSRFTVHPSRMSRTSEHNRSSSRHSLWPIHVASAHFVCG